MLKIKLFDNSISKRERYRQYSPTTLTTAYQKIVNKEMSIYKASKLYNIPKTTLLDRVSGRVGVDVVKSGPDPVLSLEEEAKLSGHIKKMALYGYGYTRSEVVTLASDLAIGSGKRDRNKSFSLQWFHSFMTRWPDLKLSKPRALDLSRAKSASQDKLDTYFSELERTLNLHGLRDKPQCIYNIDEKGVNFQHTPPKVVSGSISKPPAVTSDRSKTVTLIGAGNAMGTQIPPFIVFYGSRMRQELLDCCSAGTSGTVSSTGWSNTEVFKEYLQDHFIHYVQGLTDKQPILVIYDGHKSHVSLSVIEWAKAHNIILMVLPAHTSHILQPLDVGCYGPLSRVLNNTCHKYMRENHAPITRYNIGKLASESYVKSLSAENLKSAFRKTGIYPLDKTSIDKASTLPSNTFLNVEDEINAPDENINKRVTTDNVESTNNDKTERKTEKDKTVTETDKDKTVTETEKDKTVTETDKDKTLTETDRDKTVTDKDNNTNTNANDKDFNQDLFFSERERKIGVNIKKSKCRNVLSKITSGKTITDDKVLNDIKKHCEKNGKRLPLKRKRSEKSFQKSAASKTVYKKRKTVNLCNSMEPGPSGFQKIMDENSISSDSESDVPEKDRCCVCKRFSPVQIRNCVSVVFTSWGQCMYEECEHWTHLKFCCDVGVLRRHSVFYCPCHGLPCLQKYQ